MRKPTDEQQEVLDSPARIRVVRAVPGSGKTWLVAELIRQELSKWPSRTRGIAALSFTRVGGEEIRKAVGYELGHPHFVGTIDAFLFRYVVRPFLCQFLAKSSQAGLPQMRLARLIPPESGIQYWRQYDLGKNKKTRINLCELVWTDEDQTGKAKAAYKPGRHQPLQQLSHQVLKEVVEHKKQIWGEYGHLTHSDAGMWASYLLKNKTFGTMIRAEIIRRFPLMIVDELQDTGFFLGKSIQSILNEPAIKGILVGDPDQAIFEFNGAKPELITQFTSIHDSVCLPLSASRRCPVSVSAVASCLKESSGKIVAADNKSGRAILLWYADMVSDVRRLVNQLRTEGEEFIVKVISRSSATIDAIIGKSADDAPRLGCPAISHLHDAVALFRRGHIHKALAASYRAIEQTIFKNNGKEIEINEELKKHGIDPSQWKRLATDCLLRANTEELTETVYDWQVRMGQILDEEVSKFVLALSLGITTGKLKPQKREKWDNLCANHVPQIGKATNPDSFVPVQTVHSVKGETHDVTIFVCPERPAKHCPSVIWWSDDEKDREEKRIAYVAMTRTQGDLIVCVSEACFQRLTTTRPQFVAGFKSMTVDQFLAQ